jgi:multicomponent Na+:H+ antiporter subunit E
MLLWNVLLALGWVALVGRFGLDTLLVGFGLGAALIWMLADTIGGRGYLRTVRQATGLALFFLWELVLANLRVAYDVLTPRHHMRPAVVAIPLDTTSDVQVTVLACLITLTPGTLSLDVSPDRRTLFMHAMYVDEDGVEGVRRKIKQGFERRVIEVFA